MRLPWNRSETRFLRSWLVLGPISGSLDQEVLQSSGDEGTQTPTKGQEIKLADRPTASWRETKAWGNSVSIEPLKGDAGESVTYAFAKVVREKEGKALLSLGSRDGMRAWLNGKLVHSRDGKRSLTPDEDQIEVNFHAGENALLLKLPVGQASGVFTARILESNTILPRVAEIGPSLQEDGPDGFMVKTDVDSANRAGSEVSVEVVAPGGKIVFSQKKPRGELLKIAASKWPAGPYEVRCSTLKTNGLLFAQHLPWYKGDCLAKASELLRVAAASDVATPEGMTLRMLAEMVEDRLGGKVAQAKGNPWPKIHSPLMEFDELMLERKGEPARARPHGFYRLAYRDEVDGSPQFCRAYLPAHYSPKKKWPVVIQLHGYNPANPRYVGWWAADSRHTGLDTEFSGHEEIIYLEAHGRGNATYLYLGDQDVVRALAEAKKLFSVDQDRVYLTGDSMGGWGTWNVGTRHPELFAAIAPVFGGADYHVDMTEEQLAKLDSPHRLYQERRSSWATADSLLNLPIFVHHGDVDAAVKVDYSRWGVRLLQRWGYDVRYHEYPSYGHEGLVGDSNAALSIEWFLGHRRKATPPHVRVRSVDLRTAKAYWVQIDQMERPDAFMVADAEVMNRSLIRLDTQNVNALTLSPGASLIDSSKPLQVMWNGRPHDSRMENGQIRLVAEGATVTGLVKRPALPGAMIDFMSTPFAIVAGTSATDPEMREQCEQKAQAFAAHWREWQKQEPRFFKDTEISEADLVRYSLLLVGGPAENRIAARLINQLPVTISPDGFEIDGRSFPAKDAVLSLIYPHPLNRDRYVRLVAPTSADGMYFVEANFVNLGQLEPPYFFDFMIQDTRLPSYGLGAAADQIRVLSGYFDSHWRVSDALLVRGDEALRAKCRVIHRPKKDYVFEASLLAEYEGTYRIENGPTFVLTSESGRLVTKSNGATMVFLSESKDGFFVPEMEGHFEFTRDATGKVTGFTGISGSKEFTGRKL